jgi:hypothetical protein
VTFLDHPIGNGNDTIIKLYKPRASDAASSFVSSQFGFYFVPVYFVVAIVE